MKEPKSDEKSDEMSVRDRIARRRFIRTGAMFVAGASAVASSTSVLADDCDRNGNDLKSKQATSGSDSDTGASADPAGCGRRAPKISRQEHGDPAHRSVKVDTVRS